MEWFEPLIAVGAVCLVVAPVISHFVQKKKGTLKCECGKPRSQCTGNCTTCAVSSKNKMLDCYRKSSSQTSYLYSIKVDGMKCGMCESHINEAIRKNFDVKKVKSSRKKKETIIQSSSLLNVEEVKKVILDLGYVVSDIRLI